VADVAPAVNRNLATARQMAWGKAGLALNPAGTAWYALRQVIAAWFSKIVWGHFFQLTPVKQIVAIVKPFVAEKVLDGLRLAPLEALSVREVKGYGRQKSYLDQYGDSEYSLAFLPKVEISLWVDDTRVEDTVRRIVELARTGRIGDGKIFVLPADSMEAVLDID
jgi:nitrogen regulatory protein P-II 1